MTLDQLEQVNRTILLDVIDPDSDNLYSILANTHGEGYETNNPITDAPIQRIFNKLLVKNFEDFLNKFKPGVYARFAEPTQENIKIEFEVEKPKEKAGKIFLSKESGFLKELIELIELRQKGSSHNTSFYRHATDMGHLIMGHPPLDEFYQMRRNVRVLFNKFYPVFSQHHEDEAVLKKELDHELAKLTTWLKSPLDYLHLIITDIETQQKGSQLEKLHIPLNEKSSLHILKSPIVHMSVPALGDDAERAFLHYVTEYYQHECIPTEIIERAFHPVNSQTLLDELRQQYAKSIKQYIRITTPIVEKILGVYAFFKHHTKADMKPELLVCNSHINDIAETHYLEKLKTQLTTINTTSPYTNAIWFAIIPNVDNPNKQTSPVHVKPREHYKPVSCDALNTLLTTLKEKNILTFFSFMPSSRNTFTFLNRSESTADECLRHYEDFCEDIDKNNRSMAIPCFPNITVLPVDKSSINVKNHTINLEGIYIGSAFLAAGLFATYQCPRYMKERLLDNPAYLEEMFTLDQPGSGIDFCDHKIAQYLTTDFAKEITGYSPSTEDILKENAFGLVLDSKHNFISIYHANTLEKKPIKATHLGFYIKRLCLAEKVNTLDFIEKQRKAEADNKQLQNKIILYPQEDYEVLFPEDNGDEQ